MGAFGTIPGWLTLITVAAIGYVMLRGGSGTAVSGLTDVNRELERQLHSRDATLIEKDKQIAELKAQKDVAIAILPVMDMLDSHERRAEQRFDAQMAMFELIAKRMGKFENGD